MTDPQPSYAPENARTASGLAHSRDNEGTPFGPLGVVLGSVIGLIVGVVLLSVMDQT